MKSRRVCDYCNKPHPGGEAGWHSEYSLWYCGPCWDRRSFLHGWRQREDNRTDPYSDDGRDDEDYAALGYQDNAVRAMEDN